MIKIVIIAKIVILSKVVILTKVVILNEVKDPRISFGANGPRQRRKLAGYAQLVLVATP
jgi:hypothetical protein